AGSRPGIVRSIARASTLRRGSVSFRTLSYLFLFYSSVRFNSALFGTILFDSIRSAPIWQGTAERRKGDDTGVVSIAFVVFATAAAEAEVAATSLLVAGTAPRCLFRFDSGGFLDFGFAAPSCAKMTTGMVMICGGWAMCGGRCAARDRIG
ncbi:unnamed protein product, partial [Laminaria digitata]